jgi:hypothetical protein
MPDESGTFCVAGGVDPQGSTDVDAELLGNAVPFEDGAADVPALVVAAEDGAVDALDDAPDGAPDDAPDADVLVDGSGQDGVVEALDGGPVTVLEPASVEVAALDGVLVDVAAVELAPVDGTALDCGGVDVVAEGVGTSACVVDGRTVTGTVGVCGGRVADAADVDTAGDEPASGSAGGCAGSTGAIGGTGGRGSATTPPSPP